MSSGPQKPGRMVTPARTAAVLVGFFGVALMFAFRWLNAGGDTAETFSYRRWDVFMEGADWDPENHRFLLSSFKGGLFQVRVKESDLLGAEPTTERLVEVPESAAGSLWLGVQLDAPRHRVLVPITYLSRNYSALAAYDTRSWELLFWTELAGAGSESFADDVAVDTDGNAYVTDAASNLIWKVPSSGSESFVLTNSPSFRIPSLPFVQATLNGIEYHPDGYLLVSHTWGGALFRVSLDGKSVDRVNVTGSIALADGMALVSPQKLAIASVLGTKLLESVDGWATARVTYRALGPLYRFATSVVVKDDHVFTSYGLGFGLGEKRGIIQEAVFSPV